MVVIQIETEPPHFERFPAAQFSFEPGDIVSRIMNFGTSTPVEVAVTGPDFGVSRTFGAKIRDELGWQPTRPGLEQMVADAWAFAQAHPDGYPE